MDRRFENTPIRTRLALALGMDPAMAKEYEGGPFIGELRPDEDFDIPRCNRRQRYDPDEVEGILCHITAGAGIKFTTEELRDWLRAGDAPTIGQRDAVSDALMELGCARLRVVFTNCGASFREAARFIRNAGARSWKIVWFLNGRSSTGNDDLPVHIDKNLAASNVDWWL